MRVVGACRAPLGVAYVYDLPPVFLRIMRHAPLRGQNSQDH